MMDAEEIGRVQDERTARWHREAAGGPDGSGAAGGAETEAGTVMGLVIDNHRANFDLWHEEDKARDPGSTDAQIARVKRAIDGLNQRRNDGVEALDEMLVRGLADEGVVGGGAPLHSETPGMMVDRMSILALKIYHTREQAERSDVTEAHRVRNDDRLRVLEEQRRDLAQCLSGLWSAVLRGERRFKVYRQMKMYNDPELNPAIYLRKS